MYIWYFYSSGWGNTRLVWEYISQHLNGDHGLILENVGTKGIKTLDEYEFIILAAPTYDHGVLHEPFYRWIMQQDIDLSSKKIAIIWLWDDKYDKQYNVESAKILEDFVAKNNGKLLIPSLRINKHPIPQLEWEIKKRIEEYTTKLS